MQFGRKGPEYTAQRLRRRGVAWFWPVVHHLNCTAAAAAAAVQIVTLNCTAAAAVQQQQQQQYRLSH